MFANENAVWLAIIDRGKNYFYKARNSIDSMNLNQQVNGEDITDRHLDIWWPFKMLFVYSKGQKLTFKNYYDNI